MGKALIGLALFTLAVSLSAQQILPQLFLPSAAPAGTNIQWLGGVTNEINTGNVVTVSYACQSASNRLIVGALDGTASTTFALTDTGGQASSANIILPLTTFGSNFIEGWNMGCTTASNNITVTVNPSGNYAAQLQLVEFSGIGNSGLDASNINGAGGSGVCTNSATATQAGDLSLIWFGTNGDTTRNFFFSNGYSLETITGLGTGIYQQTYANFIANLNAPLGTVSFSGRTAVSNQCLQLLIKGTPAASPNFYPSLVQATSYCNSSNGNVVAFVNNVNSGDVITVGYKSESTTDPTGVNDTLGIAYTLRVSQKPGSNNMWIYTGKATASGADTITVNNPGFSYPCTGISEFNGLTGTVTNTGGLTASSGTMTWNQTVSNNNSIVYAVVGAYHSADTFTFGGVSYAITSAINGGDALGGEWARVVTAGTSTPIINVSTTDSNVGASIVLQ